MNMNPVNDLSFERLEHDELFQELVAIPRQDSPEAQKQINIVFKKLFKIFFIPKPHQAGKDLLKLFNDAKIIEDMHTEVLLSIIRMSAVGYARYKMTQEWSCLFKLIKDEFKNRGDFEIISDLAFKYQL